MVHGLTRLCCGGCSHLYGAARREKNRTLLRISSEVGCAACACQKWQVNQQAATSYSICTGTRVCDYRFTFVHQQAIAFLWRNAHACLHLWLCVRACACPGPTLASRQQRRRRNRSASTGRSPSRHSSPMVIVIIHGEQAEAASAASRPFRSLLPW